MRKVVWRALAALAVGLLLAIPGTAAAARNTFAWLWVDQVPSTATAGGSPVVFSLSLYDAGPGSIMISNLLLRLYTVAPSGEHVSSGVTVGVQTAVSTPTPAPTPTLGTGQPWVPATGPANGAFTIDLGGRTVAAASMLTIQVRAQFGTAARAGTWHLEPAMGTCALVGANGKPVDGTLWPFAINGSLTVNSAVPTKDSPPPTPTPTPTRSGGPPGSGQLNGGSPPSAPAATGSGAPVVVAGTPAPPHRPGRSGGGTGGYVGIPMPPTAAPDQPVIALPPMPVVARPDSSGGLVGPVLMVSGTAAILASLACLVFIWRGGRDRHVGGHRTQSLDGG